MAQIPQLIRIRLNALGRASRPLGEARARAFAREVADTIVSQLQANADAGRILDIYEARLLAELSERTTPMEPARSRPRGRSLRDVLPKFKPSDVA